MQQNYSNHRVDPKGLVIITQEGTEVLVSFDQARQLIKDLRRHLGDFHDQVDDKQRPYPAPMKYGTTERQ